MGSLPSLRPWQKTELENKAPKVLIAACPRLGKSRVATEWIASLGLGLYVFVTPLSVCPDIHDLSLATGFEVVPAYKYTSKRLNAALDPLKGPEMASVTVIVINYDMIARNIELFLKLPIKGLVIDESHYIKSPSSSRGRGLRKLAKKCAWVRLLTGTVMPNHAGDAYGQLNCVDDKQFGPSWTAWSKKHLIQDFFNYGKVLGVRNPKQFQAMLDSCMRVYKREDVFGPDKWTYTTRMIDLPAKARKAYDTIVKDWVLESEGVDLEVTHALSRMLRLRQLCAGYLPGEDGQPVELHSSKVDAVIEDVESIINAREKCVIFCQFTWEVNRYFSECKRLSVPVYKIAGDVPAEERVEAIKGFNKTEACVIVAQTSAGGIGISLATSPHALFVSQSYSFANELQARDRIYSPGHPRSVTFYRVNKSIENFIANTLMVKGNIHEAVRNSDIKSIAYQEIVQTQESVF